MRSLQHYVILSAVLMFGGFFTLQPSSATDRGSIDLVKGIFHDVSLFGLTPDKLTDILGRPQFAKPAREEMRDKKVAHIGSTFYYHDRGLSFYFYSPVTDEEERVATIHVYVTKKFDNENLIFFLPYKGEILRNVNADSKVKDIMEIFSDCELKDKDSKVLMVPPEKDLLITFEYNATTRFIEKISLDIIR